MKRMCREQNVMWKVGGGNHKRPGDDCTSGGLATVAEIIRISPLADILLDASLLGRMITSNARGKLKVLHATVYSQLRGYPRSGSFNVCIVWRQS